MNQTIPREQIPAGTLEEYRAKGETNTDIAVLVAMIDQLRNQVTKLMEALASSRGKAQG